MSYNRCTDVPLSVEISCKSPIDFRCSGVETDSDIISPTASWNPIKDDNYMVLYCYYIILYYITLSDITLYYII